MYIPLSPCPWLTYVVYAALAWVLICICQIVDALCTRYMKPSTSAAAEHGQAKLQLISSTLTELCHKKKQKKGRCVVGYCPPGSHDTLLLINCKSSLISFICINISLISSAILGSFGTANVSAITLAVRRWKALQCISMPQGATLCQPHPHLCKGVIAVQDMSLQQLISHQQGAHRAYSMFQAHDHCPNQHQHQEGT